MKHDHLKVYENTGLYKATDMPAYMILVYRLLIETCSVKNVAILDPEFPPSMALKSEVAMTVLNVCTGRAISISRSF